MKCRQILWTPSFAYTWRMTIYSMYLLFDDKETCQVGRVGGHHNQGPKGQGSRIDTSRKGSRLKLKMLGKEQKGMKHVLPNALRDFPEGMPCVMRVHIILGRSMNRALMIHVFK